MKFNLTGDQWLDPSTFRVAPQLNNNNGTNRDGFQIMVQPLSWNPAVFFRRARLICGGQVVEDIDDFNRLSLLLTYYQKTTSTILVVKALAILISFKVQLPKLLTNEKLQANRL